MSLFHTRLKKSIASWVLYDIASSGYILMVPTIVFPVYFRQLVCGAGPNCDAQWGILVAMSLAVAGVLAPLMGAIADLGAQRHRLFAASTLLCGLASIALFGLQASHLLLVGLLFLLAQVGYLSAASLYDAYLPDLVPARQIGKLSGWGWGLGYLGGITCYLLFLGIKQLGPFDLATEYRLAFLISGVFLLVLALPALAWLPRQTQNRTLPPAKLITQAYRKVWQTLSNWRQTPDVFKFLLGFYLISDGITTIGSFISIYFSTQFGLTIAQILQLTLVFNLIAIPSTIVCGILSDIYNPRWVLRILLGIWITIILLMVFSTHPATPLVLAVMLGTVMGSTQAVCRGLFAQMIRATQSAELFGFSSLVSKVSSVLGPLALGLISSATGNQRLAMASLLVFFILGGLILNRVRQPGPTMAQS